MGETYKYKITLLVTVEEENAILDLYQQKNWQYIKLNENFLSNTKSSSTGLSTNEIDIDDQSENHFQENITDITDPETQSGDIPEDISFQKYGNEIFQQDTKGRQIMEIKEENTSDNTIQYDPLDLNQGENFPPTELNQDMLSSTETKSTMLGYPLSTDVLVKVEVDENGRLFDTGQKFKESNQTYTAPTYSHLPTLSRKSAASQSISTLSWEFRNTTVADLLKLKRREAKLKIEDCTNIAEESDCTNVTEKSDNENGGQHMSHAVKERIETMIKNKIDAKDDISKLEKSVRKDRDRDLKALLDKQINETSLILQEEGKSELVCCICDKTFDTIDLFKAHAKPCLEKLTFRRLGSYTCGTCGGCFERAFSLLGHRLSQICKPGVALRDGTDYVCKHCGIKYKSRRKSEFVLHLLGHTNLAAHACTFCGKSFVRWTALRNHLRSHTGERPFVCRSCPKSFSSFMGLQCHVRTKHTEVPKSFMCEICGTSFPLKHRLTTHLRTVHTEERYKCDICGKELKTKMSVSIHKRTHSNIRNNVCDICGKAFLLTANLTLHMKRHSKEHSHFCEVCQKGFFNKQNLNIHMRVHSGDKPFSCPHCNYRCAVKGNLNKHVKSCHPNPK